MSVTIIIIVLTVIVSVMAFYGALPADRMTFNAYRVLKEHEYWRLLTHAFLHAGWGHLIINMLVLYSFGGNVETIFGCYYGSNGRLAFLAFYVSAIVVSSLWDLFKYRDSYYYNSLGASGAVNAVLFSSIVFVPTSKLFVFPIPIPLPAWLFAVLYLAYSVYMSKRGGDNIAHGAHISGAVYGALVALIIRLLMS